MHIEVTVHVYSEDDRRIQKKLSEILVLLEGLVDSTGDKEKMVALSAEVKAKREALQAATPKASADGS